jgi:uncharacterized protein YxjI
MTGPAFSSVLPAGRAFGVKEHVGAFRAANQFDITDGSGRVVLHCREPNLGIFTRLLRFTEYKKNTPFNCEVRDLRGRLVFRVSRGVSLFLSTVRVTDAADRLVATFEHKIFSIGGRFTITLPNGVSAGEVRGHWTSFDFAVTFGGRHVAQVTKQWRSLGVELFTSADQYAVVFDNDIADDDPARLLSLAAALVVDFILKE